MDNQLQSQQQLQDIKSTERNNLVRKVQILIKLKMIGMHNNQMIK